MYVLHEYTKNLENLSVSMVLMKPVQNTASKKNKSVKAPW